MPKEYKSKICSKCGREYLPGSGASKACVDCRQGRGDPPLCACGCGASVHWNRKTHAWRKFLPTHHLKGNAHRKGKPAWNKGTLKLREFLCAQCRKKKVVTRDKRTKFCSPECYYEHNRGENNVLWTGGKPKTKYQWVQIDGKNRRAHRYFMEKQLGRELRKSEVVHHIDEDGLNNELDNLHLFHCDDCHKHQHRKKAPLQYHYLEAHHRQLMP